MSVRLSDDEQADLDARRGPLKRGDYLRLLLNHDTERHATGDLKEVENESVSANGPVPQIIEETRVPNPKTVKHFHKPGVLIEEWMERGTKKSLYRCAEPTCTETMVR